MKAITYISSIEQLSQIDPSIEIVLEHKMISRMGKLSTDNVSSIFKKAKEDGFTVHLEWDVLMVEERFQEAADAFSELADLSFDSIRVQDPGAVEYILQETSFKISLNLESGNHNIEGINKWISYIGNRLDRIILSIELPINTLESYLKVIKTPVEYLGLGRILLFYTPRNLLSALLPEDDEQRKKSVHGEQFIEAMGESEESPHKGFPIVENRHGSFMFHIKNFYVLEKIKEIQSMGLSYLRFDLRDSDLNYINQISLTENATKDIKSLYSHDTTRGYFNINKTDVLFKKLKNYRTQRTDVDYIGEVVDAVKGQYTAITIKAGTLKKGSRVRLVNPEGKEYFVPVVELRNSLGEDVTELKYGQLALMNYVGGSVARTAVYSTKK